MSTIVGREPELGAVGELLDRVVDGPAVLMLAGEAGIGKTMVWRAGVEDALGRGFTVLLCRPAAPEVNLSYAGLSDLLADVMPSGFDHLPRPQRRALDAALLRASDDDPAPDPRAVAAGFLSVISELARATPVLLAIDDIQWLDEPSRQIVEFAVRRCRGPVGVLVARRDEDAGGTAVELRPRDPDRRRIVRLGPLSLGALHHVLRQGIGRPVTRPLLVRIAEVSGGNPFFAIELARGLDAPAPGAIVLPDSLQGAVRGRLERLEPPVREALRVVAALASPRVDLVGRALGEGDAAALLSAAEDHGVIELATNGGVRFTHPLLAAAVDAGVSPSLRRALHLRLSAVVDDAEERARHLALAAIGPDPQTVGALDAAAELARRRGAPSAAAELLELAINLGAGDATRRVQAAQDHFNAGNPGRADRLLEAAVAELGPGPLRARALGRLGMIRFETDARGEAAALLEQAIAEADADLGERCSIRVDLSYVLFISGRTPDSLHQIALAIGEAEQLNDDGLLAEVLVGSVIGGFLSGGGTDDASLARALALEDPDRRTSVRRWPSTIAAQVYRWTHRLDEALSAFMALRQRCIESGAESDLWFVSLGAIPAACWAGEIETARRLVDDTLERAQIVESEYALAMARLFEAQFMAWVGEVGEARRAAAEATALLAVGDVSTIALEVPAALGLVELSLGDHEAAARYLGPAAEAAIAMGFSEPASAQFLPDAAEALIALGRVDEAGPLIDLIEASGQRPDRPWARAVGARCRGLLMAAQGRPDEAAAAYHRALAAHDQLPQLRYDRARTLLALGALQRRRNQRRAAWASLAEATGLFEEVGAARWAEHARTELSRLGLRPSAGDALTPMEEHVAQLAASGLTNREVAAALFVSPKTVDAHLTRIYRKLDIRSRAELGWRMAERAPQS